MIDYDYHRRLDYLAGLIEKHYPDAWHGLSKEALDMYPVDSEKLRDKYLSFEYFLKAVNITLDRMEKEHAVNN